MLFLAPRPPEYDNDDEPGGECEDDAGEWDTVDPAGEAGCDPDPDPDPEEPEPEPEAEVATPMEVPILMRVSTGLRLLWIRSESKVMVPFWNSRIMVLPPNAKYPCSSPFFTCCPGVVVRMMEPTRVAPMVI